MVGAEMKDPQRLNFIVESGADVRMIEGIRQHFNLSVLARRIVGGVEISRPPNPPADIQVGPPSRIGFARAALDFLAKSNPASDFILAQSYGLAAYAANRFGKRNQVPVFLLVCNSVEAYYRSRRQVNYPGKRFRWREYLPIQIMARINALYPCRYIALSQHLKSTIMSHGVAANRIEVIPLYGVDTEVFHPSTKNKLELKKSLGLPEKGPVIFFSSRLSPEKDAETLLEAFKQMIADSPPSSPPWLLTLSGGYEAVLSKARQLGIENQVIARDAVHPTEALPAFYQCVDLCVQASREEGLGFSPLEALACGCPVVAANVGGLQETIREGETGWSYPVSDVTRLKNQMQSVLNASPDDIERRVSAGQRMVQSDYESKSVFLKFRDHLQQYANDSHA